MLHECRAIYVYGSFWTQKSMVAFIFHFDLRKRQCQVKLGKIFKINIFLQRHAYLVQFCPRIPRNVIYFCDRQLDMPKIVFQRVALSPLPDFLTIA